MLPLPPPQDFLYMYVPFAPLVKFSEINPVVCVCVHVEAPFLLYYTSEHDELHHKVQDLDTQMTELIQKVLPL